MTTKDEIYTLLKETPYDGRDVKDDTLKTYSKNTFNVLNKTFDNVNIKDVSKHDDIIDFLENNSQYKNSSKHGFYTSLMAIVRRLYPDNKKAYESYKTLADEKTNIYRSKKISGEYNDDNDIMIHDWQELIKNDSMMLKCPHRIIASLYLDGGLDLPPRRGEYKDLKITFLPIKKVKQLSDKYNYLRCTKTKAIEIVFNSYKTKSSYGQQVLKLSKKQSKVISTCISQYIEGDLVFGSLSVNQYNKYFTSVMKELTGYKLGIRDLRTAYVTFLYKQNPSADMLREQSDKLAHSLMVNSALYNQS